MQRNGKLTNTRYICVQSFPNRSNRNNKINPIMRPFVFCASAAWLLFLIFSGCSGDNNPLRDVSKAFGSSGLKKSAMPGGWELAGPPNAVRRGGDSLPAEIRLLTEQPAHRALEHGMICNFFNDGDYTEVFGKQYRQGTWKLSRDKQNIVLQFGGAPANDTFFVKNFGDQMFVMNWRCKGVLLECTLQKTALSLRDPEKDPFHPKNNVWRQPPAGPESEEALRTRLHNHVRHNLAIFTAAKERESVRLSWQYTPTCIQVLNGGIAVKNTERIPPEFYRCFHSEADAARAVNILTPVVKRFSRPDKKSGSWTQDDALLLEKVADQLR
jgi:hypothetical protein